METSKNLPKDYDKIASILILHLYQENKKLKEEVKKLEQMVEIPSKESADKINTLEKEVLIYRKLYSAVKAPMEEIRMIPVRGDIKINI